ncbi:MAG: hypothetical protein E7679_02795 [Ruminococcaceae bacterium]|nr:hypothetical protein [Oscillospiraceae bacterium]
MKKWNLFAAIFQIVVGIAAIVAYIILATSGEPMGKWTVTLILAIAFVVIGAINAVDHVRSNKTQK